MSGKGSGRRPSSVPPQTFAERWARRRAVNEGYIKVFFPEHHRADKDGWVMEHIVVAEQSSGATLSTRAVVHHVNGIKDDNRPANLVICEDRGYHALLHLRQRALEECGNPAWRRCYACGQWDDPTKMSTRDRGTFHHAICNARRAAEYKERKRIELGREKRKAACDTLHPDVAPLWRKYGRPKSRHCVICQRIRVRNRYYRERGITPPLRTADVSNV